MKHFFFAAFTALSVTTYAQVSKFSDLRFFVGSGPDTVAVSLDFHQPYSTTSFTFGVLTNDSISWNQVISDIGAADPNVNFGFGIPTIINFYDLTKSNSGPNKWVLLVKNGSGWDRDHALQSHLVAGDWGAMSYLDTTKALVPEVQETALPPNAKGYGDIQYYLGSGSDTATLVVDFLSQYPHNSYRYGVLFNDSITIEDMLVHLDQDTGIEVSILSGFLYSIRLQRDSGESGMPNYWGTWSGPSLSGLLMNQGVNTYIHPNEVAGCSYTDFQPGRRPRIPISGIPSYPIEPASITSWTGTGSDTTILVIDFKDGKDPLAFGYIFDAPATVDQMINDIEASRSDLTTMVSGGFLMDLSFGNRSGLGGNPNYWGIWSASNGADWYSNAGMSTSLENGGWIGLSYMNFSPAIPPYVPVAAPLNLGVGEEAGQLVEFGPNPTTRKTWVMIVEQGQFEWVDPLGRVVRNGVLEPGRTYFDLGEYGKGLYTLRIQLKNETIIQKILLQ